MLQMFFITEGNSNYIWMNTINGQLNIEKYKYHWWKSLILLYVWIDYQRWIQNPNKHLRWSLLQKLLRDSWFYKVAYFWNISETKKMLTSSKVCSHHQMFSNSPCHSLPPFKKIYLEVLHVNFINTVFFLERHIKGLNQTPFPSGIFNTRKAW